MHPGSDWPSGLPGDSRWAGGPVGRWAGGPVGMVGRLAGGQQKDYDILFLLAIDVINYDFKKKQNWLSRVIMAKRQRQKSLNLELWYSILFQMWRLAITLLLINNPVFNHNICGFLTNDESNIISIRVNYFVFWSSVYPGKYLLEIIIIINYYYYY